LSEGRFGRLWPALRLVLPTLAVLGGAALFLFVLAVRSVLRGGPGFVALGVVCLGMGAYLVVKLVVGMRRYLRTQPGVGATARAASQRSELNDHRRVFGLMLKGRPVPRKDRAVAERLLRRRLWRDWRLALLIVSIPATPWMIYRSVTAVRIGADAVAWGGLLFFGAGALLIPITIRHQVLLRRWLRLHGKQLNLR
jgi:hypothetical protein